jgi:hypothetical protein
VDSADGFESLNLNEREQDALEALNERLPDDEAVESLFATSPPLPKTSTRPREAFLQRCPLLLREI